MRSARVFNEGFSSLYFSSVSQMRVAWDFRIVDREVDMQVEITRKMEISPGFTLVMSLQVKTEREVKGKVR